jgi:tetratricopeptide (TPR) repeat protein
MAGLVPVKQDGSSCIDECARLLARARKQHEAGGLVEAEAGYNKVLALDESNADAWHMIGVVALQTRRSQMAVDCISRALSLRPEFPEALNNLGSVMLAMGNVGQAEKLIRMAIKLNPDYVDALGNLGVVLTRLDRPREAIPYLVRATRLNPQSALLNSSLGNALRNDGRVKDAEQAYRKAIELDASNAAYTAAMGSVLMEIGEYEEATEEFIRALSLDPLCISALCGLVSSKKVRAGDTEIQLFRRAATGVPLLSPSEQADFLFAWGKLHDDIGEYDEAFRCAAEANRLRRLQRPYSRVAEEGVVDAVSKAYTKDLFDRLGSAGVSTDAPVFVIGMPRSGTTLVEQILTSHPQIEARGELKLMARLFQDDLGVGNGNDLNSALTSLTATKVNDLASRYLDEIGQLALGGLRFTDKMPSNFLHVGLIRLMFPRARIIHVRRSPVDTLLSCFQKNFREGQPFSNDLADAGHYYGLYRRVMAHWDRTFPGYMLHVDYEALVAEPEDESRRLVAHVGLEWDDACLKPSDNRRAVHTASQWQVRQPIYSGAVGRWRAYEQYLGPLFDALHQSEVEIE